MKPNPIWSIIPHSVLFNDIIYMSTFLLDMGGKVSFNLKIFPQTWCILKVLQSLRVREWKQDKFRMSLLSIYFASSSSLSLGGLGNKHTSCLSVLRSWQVEAYLNSQNHCSFLSPFESPPLSATRYHVNVMYRRNCHGHGY